ncbi:hypothetical protein FisN_17Lh082 [Fistulifera solaris]|uniref:DUF1995 domain-containing protein n=1 Tax=Fistulifera solaris TaxID=1519565 RepID=A0A1Z5K1V8_FISSO|nr:hypothetical protein FisN_17Lh082 [Fistulifera solaris]|eukprot:GAX20132.1 hypothetical protein FisN_17Lh082 [Fistulifera solaris]
MKTSERTILHCILFQFLVISASAFVPSPTRSVSTLLLDVTEESSSTVDSRKKTDFTVPLSVEEMVRQVAACMKLASSDGRTKQIIRVLLPRDANNADFGKYWEQDSTSRGNSILVPNDESWQGGIMQLYRSAAPTGAEILRQYTKDVGLPPRITEDRSVDESGVDGVGLLQTEDPPMACWVQPTQETVQDHIMDTLNDADTTIILMNPQWRLVDDVLDSASQGEGFLSGLASFLGGKGSVLKRLNAAGFQPVYTLEGYVCRGANVRLLQSYQADWQVFCERDDGETYIPVGSLPSRPTYQDVEQMLNDANIGYKYARDIGLQPKL